MVGDKAIDIEAGRAAGCRTILVMTGKETQTKDPWNESFKPTHVANDLLAAVEWITSMEE